MIDDTSSGKPVAQPDRCFRDAVADVEPLARRGIRHESPPKQKAGMQAKREAAEGSPNRDESGYWATAVEVDAVGAGEVLGWKSAGVQQRVFDRLKAGRLEIRHELDLHGMTVREAGEALFQLLEGTKSDRQCCLLIVHGPGTATRKPARLKSGVYAWLRQHPRVVALHSADRRNGGTGATFALLRRSP